MSQIYQKAAEVIIWLGEADDDLITPITVINDCFAERNPPTWGNDGSGYNDNSGVLVNTSGPRPLQALSENILQYWSRGFDEMVRKLVDILYGHEGETEYQMNDLTWTALEGFYDRPWFH